MITLRRGLLLAACLAAAAVAGCSSDPEPTPTREQTALALVESYQQAMLRGDRATLRGVLTAESHRALASVPLAVASGKKPVRIVDATRHGSQVLVRVTDPNHSDQRSTYVCVWREGELRLDLVASVQFAQAGERKRAGLPAGAAFGRRALDASATRTR